MEHNQRGQLTTIADVLQFVQAGNATFTLVSKVTGARRTYKMRESDRAGMFFVQVMTGPDNENDFQYLGIVRNGSYEIGKKSRITRDSPAHQAFDWFWRRVAANAPVMFTALEVWHEGRCGCCGRKLTVPESVERGIGPECARGLGMAPREDHLAQYLDAPKKKIVVRIEGVDGAGQRRKFTTIAGASAFARKFVGDTPEMGSTYAVSGDGVCKATCDGCTLRELFPAVGA